LREFHEIDIEWLSRQNVQDLMNEASENAAQNIKQGRPSHQAVYLAVSTTLRIEPNEALSRALTGFGGGVAGSGQLCGALCGGIASLSYIFGTAEPVDFSNLKEIIKDTTLTPYQKMERYLEDLEDKGQSIYNHLFNKFQDLFGTTSCEKLIAPFFPNIITKERFYKCHEIIIGCTALTIEVVFEVFNHKGVIKYRNNVMTNFLSDQDSN
jgi:C_GCAxxG_C_C family probable redox protein